MNTFEQNARISGYMDALNGENLRHTWQGFTRERAAYDTGYQDGAIMRAVRSGDLSGITPFVPSVRSNPRPMLADDISATGDTGRGFLLASQMRKMKENAYYFLQYYLAVNGPPKIPDFYVEMARGILGKEPGEGERKIGKSEALGMGYDPGKEKFEGTVTGRWSTWDLSDQFPVCTCEGEGFGGPRHTKDCPKYVPGPPL